MRGWWADGSCGGGAACEVGAAGLCSQIAQDRWGVHGERVGNYQLNVRLKVPLQETEAWFIGRGRGAAKGHTIRGAHKGTP